MWISLTIICVIAFGGLILIFATNNHPALGLDLRGGISVTLEPKPGSDYDSAGLDLAVDQIRSRVDSLGVAEPEIVRQGDAIVVNLPGVKDQDTALRLVQVTGQVYLRPVLQCSAPVTNDSTTTTSSPTGSAPVESTPSTGDVVTGSTAAAASGLINPRSVTSTSSTVPPADAASTSTTAPGAAGTTLPGETTTTVAGGTTTTSTVPASDPTQAQVLPTLDGAQCYVGPAAGTGEVFERDAQATVIPGKGWGVNVNLRDNADGIGVWNQLAAQCYNRTSTCPTGQLAIELDGTIVSYPTVNQPSFDTGGVEISGSFKEGEAKNLARVLRSGALPVQLQTQTVQNVSPTLGEDSLRAAIVAGSIGVLLVLLFMLAYYRALGIVVIGGVVVSGALIWSVVALLSRTSGLALSLAGITGIIVSVGVTVDSYVVFFERLKDEVRAGRSMRNGAQRAFSGAWHTILVADLVSLMGALVLWYLTVGSVRNFAFFLGLSTLCDLIVAYTFTRPSVLLLAQTHWMARRKVMGIEATTTSGGDR